MKIWHVARGGARLIGAAIGAIVGEFYGAETCLVVASAGFLIQATVILRSPVKPDTSIPDEDDIHWRSQLVDGHKC